jgi:hypothetical protein
MEGQPTFAYFCSFSLAKRVAFLLYTALVPAKGLPFELNHTRYARPSGQDLQGYHRMTAIGTTHFDTRFYLKENGQR